MRDDEASTGLIMGFDPAPPHHPNRVIAATHPVEAGDIGIPMAVAGLQVAHWGSGPAEGAVTQG